MLDLCSDRIYGLNASSAPSGFPAANKQLIEETVLTRRFHGMHWGALHSTGRADPLIVGSSHPSWILCTGGVHIFLPPGGEVAGSTFPLRGGMQMTRIILVCHRSNSARDIRRTVIDQEPPGSRFAPAGSLNRGPAGVIQKITTKKLLTSDFYFIGACSPVGPMR